MNTVIEYAWEETDRQALFKAGHPGVLNNMYFCLSGLDGLLWVAGSSFYLVHVYTSLIIASVLYTCIISMYK